MSYMDTKFCEVCDEDYDWAAPTCPGCAHRKYVDGLQRNLDQVRGELEILKSRVDALRRVEIERDEARRENLELRTELSRFDTCAKCGGHRYKHGDSPDPRFACKRFE